MVGGSGLRLHLVEWGEGERVVLLLHGFLEHARVWDWVAPRFAAARLAILRARHVRVDAAGHHPHIERPEAFADVVIRFLADVE